MKKHLYIIRMIISIIALVLFLIASFVLFNHTKTLDIQAVQRMLIDSSVAISILLCFAVIITLLFGRVLCSLVGPWGIFQDIVGMIRGETDEYKLNIFQKCIIAVVVYGIIAGLSIFSMKFIKMHTNWGSASLIFIIGFIAFVVSGILALFKKRLFCEICPVGAVFGLISKISLFKMHINSQECLSCGTCERNCPSDCIDLTDEKIDNSVCVKCFKCMSQCPKEAISYAIKSK